MMHWPQTMMDGFLQTLPFVLGLLVYGLSKNIGQYRLRSPWFVLSPHAADRLVFLFALTYVILFSTLTLLLHFSLNGADDDVGLFHQVIWNSLRGRLLETTLIPDIRSLNEQRFSPILLAFVPLYAIWDNFAVLLLVQTLGISVGVFPLYWLARRWIGRPLGVLIALAYFLFPALQHVNLFGFHEIALAIPLLAYACFFLFRARYVPFLVCVLLTLLIKEEMALIAASFGAYLFLATRQRRLGLVLGIGAMCWFIALLQWIIPFFWSRSGGSGYYYFGRGIAAGMGRYDYLGTLPAEIVWTMLTRPDLVLSNLLVPRKIEYALALILPLGLLPVVGWEMVALAFPTLALSLLSNYPLQSSLASHYAAAFVVFFLFGALLGIRRLINVTHPVERRARALALGVLLGAAMVVNYYLYAPGPLARQFKPERLAITSRTWAGYELLRMIPADATVVAQRGLVLHIAGRREAYEFPGRPEMGWQKYVIADQHHDAFRLFENEWKKYLNSGLFEIAAQKEGWILLQRRAAEPISVISFEDQLTLIGYWLVSTEARGGTMISPLVEWRAERALTERYIIHARLTDTRGHIFARDDREPRRGLLPTSEWIPKQAVADQFIFNIPSVAPSGTYHITVGVYNPRTGAYLEPRDAKGTPLPYEVSIGTVRVEKDTTSKIASELFIENPLRVDMGEIRLLGLASYPRSIDAGQTFAIGFYWRARSQPRGDYHVIVQLRDPNDRVVLEQTSRPAGGTYSTLAWHVGEVVLDWHDLDLPHDLGNGDYQVFVLLCDAATQTLVGQAHVGQITVRK